MPQPKGADWSDVRKRRRQTKPTSRKRQKYAYRLVIYSTWQHLHTSGMSSQLLATLNDWYPADKSYVRDLVKSTRRWLEAVIEARELPAGVAGAGLFLLYCNDVLRGFVVYKDDNHRRRSGASTSQLTIVRTIKDPAAYAGTGVRLIDALRKELPRQTYVVEGSQCTAKLRTFYEACGFVASEGAANSADYLMIRIEEQSGGGDLACMRQERHKLRIA